MALDTEHDDDIDVLDVIDPDLFPLFLKKKRVIVAAFGLNILVEGMLGNQHAGAAVPDEARSQ